MFGYSYTVQILSKLFNKQVLLLILSQIESIWYKFNRGGMYGIKLFCTIGTNNLFVWNFLKNSSKNLKIL